MLAIEESIATEINNRSNRILLVDDEQDIASAFTIGLEEYGFEVDVFNDPEEALFNFRAGWYGLLLLDIRMPKINGFELYRRLCEKDRNVKVCFMTAYELYYEALKKDYPTLDVGCFIQKPTTIDGLVKHVCTELRIPSRVDNS
jgi:DNA-binding response OmpR family regulator